MSLKELKEDLVNLVNKSSDEQAIYKCIITLLKSDQPEPGTVWNSLTEEQKQVVLLSLEESEDEANLIPYEEVKKSMARWLSK